jgi:hypothetical protein
MNNILGIDSYNQLNQLILVGLITFKELHSIINKNNERQYFSCSKIHKKDW